MLHRLTVVAGGTERQDSVALGLSALDEVDIVAVHDAARPLADSGLLDAGIDLLRSCDGAIPVQPVHDTIKRIDRHGAIVETIDRTMLRAAQTPQVFRAQALRTAHEQAVRERRTLTDDASLLEQSGYCVKVFPGSPTNMKITTDYDLHLARLLVKSGLRP